MQPGTEFNENLVADHNAFVYVINGELALESTDGNQLMLVRDQLAVLGKGELVTLKGGDQESRFLLVAGKPLNEPVARHGPFVMNTETELRQAFVDYQQGNF